MAGGRPLEVAYGDPFDRSVERFLEVVRSGDRSRHFCTPEDALQTLRVAAACEQSLEEGGRVEVPGWETGQVSLTGPAVD